MGTQQSKELSRQVEFEKSLRKEVNTQLQQCFQHCQNNNQFLNKLFPQHPVLVSNLTKAFPKSLTNYGEFLEMFNFLVRTDMKPVFSQFAIYNAPKTNSLDRFMMLCLGIQKSQQYDQKSKSLQELEIALLNLLRMFRKDPQIGIADKLCKFCKINTASQISLKYFISGMRKEFPQLNKLIFDYFTKKFRDMEKQFYLLDHFTSKFLKEDAIILNWQIPQLAGSEIKQLYDSDLGGFSLHSYERKIIGYDGPWLLLIETSEKESYRFGTFQSGPIRDVLGYQGDLRGFLFSIHPNIRFMTTDKGENGDRYFFINLIDQKISKIRKGLGFGGDINKVNCKLWIDQDFDKSSVFNGNDPTYGFGTLANPLKTGISIKKMQIWGLGTKFDLQKQAQYWQDREQQIMKRRKVNKKQLFQGGAIGLMLESTFAHRDQIVGQFEKKQDKQ